MQPEKSRKKSHVCTMQYVHSNPHTLLLTSHSLACKVRRVVLTLKAQTPFRTKQYKKAA